MTNPPNFLQVLKQIFRFGIIGVCAALLHFTIVIGLVESKFLLPLSANIVAFIFAVQISYWGHRCWTFQGTNVTHKVAIIRLLTLYLLTLMINESLFYVFLKMIKIPYVPSLLIDLFLMAILTFIANKRWVFKNYASD